jgi:hypothetical protein
MFLGKKNSMNRAETSSFDHLLCINKFIYLKKVDTKYIFKFSNDVFCFVVHAVA